MNSKLAYDKARPSIPYDKRQNMKKPHETIKLVYLDIILIKSMMPFFICIYIARFNALTTMVCAFVQQLKSLCLMQLKTYTDVTTTLANESPYLLQLN